MFDREIMLQHERKFCRIFTREKRTSYGVLYHNPDNPQSHDSNHALILDLATDIDSALDDISAFYGALNIPPRIYQAFLPGELVRLQPFFAVRHFTVNLQSNQFLFFAGGPSSSAPKSLALHRFSTLEPDVLAVAASGADPDWGEWSVKVMEAALKDDGYHLLGLYANRVCVALAAIQILDGYSRVDDVKTRAEFRRQGHGTALMKLVTAYHASRSGNHLYLYASEPHAIRMYRKVGFQDIACDRPFWTAMATGQ